MKYSQAINRKNDDIEIHLVRGESIDGVQIYAYLATHAGKVKDLKLSLLLKETKLKDYGIIIASGEGEPTDEVREYVNQYLV
ncbi:MAG: hypothetical protein COV36_01220 [Alphaproteobacteria bacterium CG11_big_fil_rev_8_21_14_0_20_44_7]|nr:MAG: hypothetical protein COV36_01220 [Alphaproteobacteria bacterium CG11_big_fil_rev_8_21_14_0_20_44_7]